jgi:hypothetical protein
MHLEVYTDVDLELASFPFNWYHSSFVHLKDLTSFKFLFKFGVEWLHY